MTEFQTISLLLVAAASGAFINLRYFKLPSSIGLMLFALLLSLAAVVMESSQLIDLTPLTNSVAQINFSKLLLHGLLSFLLFAGAMHVDLYELKRHGVLVAILATAGVVVATFITGTLVWWIVNALGFPLAYLHALLFGALISPTDPVAVMSILQKIGVSRNLLIKIGGESLLNDGMGVVVFLAILAIAKSPGANVPFTDIGFLVIWMGLGGIIMGLSLGWIGLLLIRSIDDYKVEVLLTLALAAGVYCLAEIAEVSAPVATVVAGLMIGHHGAIGSMPDHAHRHLDMFWELLDEILNAVLFVLIGLEMMVVDVRLAHLPLGLTAIIAMLVGRYISVAIPIGLMRSRYGFGRGTVTLLTWGGLRGGISIALALSLPPINDKNIIIAMTYMTVVFSVLFQGTTFATVARAVLKKSPEQPTP